MHGIFVLRAVLQPRHRLAPTLSLGWQPAERCNSNSRVATGELHLDAGSYAQAAAHVFVDNQENVSFQIVVHVGNDVTMPAERAVTRKAISEKRHGGLNVGHVGLSTLMLVLCLSRKILRMMMIVVMKMMNMMFSLTETTHVLSPMRERKKENTCGNEATSTHVATKIRT